MHLPSGVGCHKGDTEVNIDDQALAKMVSMTSARLLGAGRSRYRLAEWAATVMNQLSSSLTGPWLLRPIECKPRPSAYDARGRALCCCTRPGPSQTLPDRCQPPFALTLQVAPQNDSLRSESVKEGSRAFWWRCERSLTQYRVVSCGPTFDSPRSTRETTGSVHSTSQEADMASNGEEVDVRGEVVDLLIEKIASDRNPSVTMMNLVEQLLAPDDVQAYAAVLMDKVKTEKHPSISMIAD